MTELTQETIEGDIKGGGEPLRVHGRLQVTGSVLDGGLVYASGDIMIRGRVENAHVESSGGGIYVDQGITGEKTLVKAFGDIKTPFVRDAEVECSGSLYVQDVIFQARARARHIVELKGGDGIIEASYVEAGMEVAARSLGSYAPDMKETVVVLENFRQKELFELALVYEQRLKQKSQRVEELEKVIQVIRILGSRVTTLSPDKKQELALKVKEYNELKIQVEEILREKGRVTSERDKTNNLLRAVTVSHEVFPGVKVRIDNAHVMVNKRYSNVIFYKSGIVIIGDLDKFRERKRMSF